MPAGSLIAALFGAAAFFASAVSVRADESTWAAMKQPGVIALIRHADAPGAGDPQGWRLDDCKTQRNLSERGRKQARALGEAFRAQAVRVGKVMASQWCRAYETAELMAIGPVEQIAAFNNAYVLFDQRDRLSRDANAALAAWDGADLLVVVTHGDNIQLLTGVMPSQGEIVLVERKPDRTRALTVIGRIRPGAV